MGVCHGFVKMTPEFNHVFFIAHVILVLVLLGDLCCVA